MKKVNLLLALVAVMLYSTNAIAQIPNSGFENWTSKGFPSYLDPDDWGTVNSQTNIIGVHTVQRGDGANAHSGNYSVRLESIFIAFAGEIAPGITVTGQFNTNTRAVEGGFPFTGRPTGMKGWYKYTPATDGNDSDSLSIEVDIWKWDGVNNQRIMLVDNGFVTGQTVGSFAEFDLLFNWMGSQTPDSAQIVLSASRPTAPIAGSLLFVDDLSFYTLPLTNTKDSTTALCAGVCDGAVSVSVSGGNAPYTYDWDNGDNTASLTNTCPGTYTVTITDAANTTMSESATVDATTTISVSTSTVDEACGQEDGKAIATGGSGNAPYSYSWDDANTQTNDTASDLSAGVYSVTVTDAQGCVAEATVTVSNLGGLSATTNAIDASCNGGTDGEVSVTPSGGSGPFTYSWGTNAGNATDSSVAALGAGTYSVTVTDNVGCEFSVSATINEPTAITLLATATDISCFGGTDGTATVSGSGGATPFTYDWSNGATTKDLSGLSAGSYTVTVTDNQGCTASEVVTVSQPNEVGVSLTATDESAAGNEDGKIEAVVTGGTTPYTYTWDDNSNQTTSVATGLPAGVYTVTVTDAAGCERVAIDTVNVSVGVELVDNSISLDLFPNPATEVLYVNYEGADQAMISIYDLKGQLVERTVLIFRTNSIVTSSYAAGVYVYELSVENGTALARGKFVVGR